MYNPDSHVMYGFCPVCSLWVKRDSMKAMNVLVYDDDNKERKIRIRTCKECHVAKVKELEAISWENVLMTEKELIGKFGAESIKK